MTDEQRQDYARRQAEAAGAMTPQEMARRQAESARYSQNAAYPCQSQAEGMRNAWGPARAQGGEFMPAKPRPTLWELCKRWLRA